MENKIKYSLILPYHDRAILFGRTLDSLGKLYWHRRDYEIILVVDSKTGNNRKLYDELMDVLRDRSYCDIVYTPGVDLKTNQAGRAHNLGVSKANGDYVVLTNPEVLHETDVLKGLDEEFGKDPSVYVVCACKSLDKDGSSEKWYQHSVHRNENFHFCNAIHKDMFKRIGGISEEFSEGYGYEDNDFRDRLLYGGVKFVVRDDLITAHQWHERIRHRDIPHTWDNLWNKNKTLWERNRERYKAEGAKCV